MGGEARVPGAVRKIVELVGEAPEGIARADIAAVARRRHAGLPEARLAKLVAQAVAAGLLHEANGRLLSPAARDAQQSGGAELSGNARQGLRAVAIDLESIVRTVTAEPYLERHVYQVAARRFGTDGEWEAQAPRWECFVRPACGEDEIRDAAVRQRLLDEGVEPDRAWAQFAAYIAGADVVVAYNGTGLDFPLVREATERAGVPDPFAECDLADALYLAHAVWPAASSHRLHALAEAVGIPMADLTGHRAPDDAELLVRLLERASNDLGRWQSELTQLVADACTDCPGWRLLLELSGVTGHDAQVWDHQRVARLVGAEIAGHQPRRVADGPGRGRASLAVPGSLRGDDGKVDPTRLAAVVHGSRAEPRPAQQHMAETLHAWTGDGTSGLLEAPTGTGKSYAVLAAALEWLAGATDRTAVIATFTKQLQSQMARDLKDLERALPGVLGVADLVKGQSNRLSLAGLTSLVAEATRVLGSARSRSRFVERPRFRELALYLYCCVCAPAPRRRSRGPPGPSTPWTCPRSFPTTRGGCYRCGCRPSRSGTATTSRDPTPRSPHTPTPYARPSPVTALFSRTTRSRSLTSTTCAHSARTPCSSSTKPTSLRTPRPLRSPSQPITATWRTYSPSAGPGSPMRGNRSPATGLRPPSRPWRSCWTTSVCRVSRHARLTSVRRVSVCASAAAQPYWPARTQAPLAVRRRDVSSGSSLRSRGP